MQVGDIVKISDDYAMDSHHGIYGVVIAIVSRRTIEVAFPMNTNSYRISMLELVSESR